MLLSVYVHALQVVLPFAKWVTAARMSYSSRYHGGFLVRRALTVEAGGDGMGYGGLSRGKAGFGGF